MSGFILRNGFSTYPNAFPKELIDEFIEKTGVKGILCNEVGSGTEILKRFGEEHIKTGYPIIYTSADSVFQIAAHEDIISVEKLYEICKIAQDLFVGRGITKKIHTEGNADGIEKTIEEIKENTTGLIYTNLVDFDMLYGHRNNIEGYAKALEYFDSKIPKIMSSMKDTDILIITSDHGNDPSTPSTDHSREYVPILVYGANVKENVDLGIRSTYADISATILDILGLEQLEGESFKEEILKML